MEKAKIKGATKKLQDLVKKKKTQTIVIKAGSIKYTNHNSSGSSSDYYTSFSDD